VGGREGPGDERAGGRGGLGAVACRPCMPTPARSGATMTDGHEADTVANAAATPDVTLPYRDPGPKDDEHRRLVGIRGRRRSAAGAGLATYAGMSTEHCSDTPPKIRLRQFGDKTTGAMRDKLLVGIGENAGVVDIGDGWAVTFKVESHNSPSFVEPYQGAAT